MPVDNPRFPHTCKISRVVRGSATQSKSPRNDDDEQESVVIYEGICRSFDFHTTSSSGELISSNRKLSLPQKQDEWRQARKPKPIRMCCPISSATPPFRSPTTRTIQQTIPSLSSNLRRARIRNYSFTSINRAKRQRL